MKMKNLKVRVSSSDKSHLMALLLVVALALALLPLLIVRGLSGIFDTRILLLISTSGGVSFAILSMWMYLHSRFTPILLLRIRAKLILFTEQFTKQVEDGNLKKSVEWGYCVSKDRIFIEFFPDGLVSDKQRLSRQLSEYLRRNLLKFEELDDRVQLTFGETPKRLDGKTLITSEIVPKYQPIPIYDEINWDLTSEAGHILLIAPTGGGKSMFLGYLAAMILKRGHTLAVVDAKNTSFGATFRSVGVPVASSPEEIIRLLTDLVNSMKEDYAKYFSSDRVSLKANFTMFKLPAHVLIFDEVLSALESGDKKQKSEMERLLKLLALKGRMAGYLIVLTSQRLLSTDLSKAITEQCQTRFIMGSNVSEELFHVAIGAYKKDLGTSYKGNVGQGYALTPTTGLAYFESPIMNFHNDELRTLMYMLRKEKASYGQNN